MEQSQGAYLEIMMARSQISSLTTFAFESSCRGEAAAGGNLGAGGLESQFVGLVSTPSSCTHSRLRFPPQPPSLPGDEALAASPRVGRAPAACVLVSVISRKEWCRTSLCTRGLARRDRRAVPDGCAALHACEQPPRRAI